MVRIDPDIWSPVTGDTRFMQLACILHRRRHGVWTGYGSHIRDESADERSSSGFPRRGRIRTYLAESCCNSLVWNVDGIDVPECKPGRAKNSALCPGHPVVCDNICLGHFHG